MTASRELGSALAPRHAMVLEVPGTPGNEHYRVKWADDEHESIFFPGPDASVKRSRDSLSRESRVLRDA